MFDVLIVGAGPAGAVAGTVLARAGVSVRLIDRATFPRDKLCGDTLNPGALAILRRLGLSAGLEDRALRVAGMRLTGEDGVAIDGRYPDGLYGLSLVRRDMDWVLLQSAIAAGVQFDDAVPVRRAVVLESGGTRSIRGVVGGGNGSEHELLARVTIAADGRHSTIAFGLGLARHPDRPRRWAIGAYFEGVLPDAGLERFSDRCSAGLSAPRDAALKGPRYTPSCQAAATAMEGVASTVGEMHVRRGRYIGVAPVPGGLTNVCLVIPSGAGDPALRDPVDVLRRELARDPMLRDRFAGARLARPPVLLGPLAVDVSREALDGLLLAGDASGFIDPMTGDGLRFAIRGGELAANAALEALEHGWTGVHDRLARQRRSEFGAKWRFNRTLRTLVASPPAVTAAAYGARLAPAMFRAMVAFAGDCGAAR